MAIYFAFDLPALAKQSLYLPLLEDTESIFDVSARIGLPPHGHAAFAGAYPSLVVAFERQVETAVRRALTAELLPHGAGSPSA